MAKYTIEDIKKYKEMGILTEEDASELTKAIVMAELGRGQSGSNNNGGNKHETGAKGGRKRLTEEEKKAREEARREARRAEQKAWGEANFTPEERKAYGEQKAQERLEKKIRDLAIAKVKVYLGGKYVSKDKWLELVEQFTPEAKKEIDEAMVEAVAE